jgi:REP element-mobilizing transposase RayT
MVQTNFGFKTPRRKKRGRKKTGRAGVKHAVREFHHRCPLHITVRMRREVWNLRSGRCFRVLERAFYAGCRRFGGQVCHFSVQHDHIHMLVEAGDRVALARVLQGLEIRMAKGLNRVMERKGKVFADRYHAVVLRTPSQVRAALVYVLMNGRKHLTRFGHKLPAGWVDPFSSAMFFDEWTVGGPLVYLPGPVAPAETWLLAVGYRRAGGQIRPDEMPASGRREASGTT